ncbi:MULTISPECIES: acetyl-CoA carboxylase biotin carboxylase subunit [Amycolatopsis]|uniref:biotin carboxylase n=1 Tax=Amycolatopsis dendrobii TaxID=2760662 RepID=A0A7W3W6W9_9PSEU|nr:MULTISPECIES: acetyl-CoA carboxylase biotin carboxylase subunit [Amycolatopsis]MBB1159969.1 acetyl-CoA carboxylase biotin carboxylase subunit [Amycolatopsis dendrobii]UKD56033.1 acetyl-CoA carboxylase biotin carboxylase subunit [Amycolatopsis sp. FU40]
MKRLLIANRGEIAVRIIRAANDLGIETVAVVSEADRNAAHALLADQVVPIGPAPATKSYLVADAILAAAKETGADAVHPGYGFLSERASFAAAVADAGLTFVGPEASVIEQMGDKVRARQVAQAAGVPTVPGTPGGVSDVAEAVAAASEIGYPIMLKAAAGGGGRGIRVVANEAELKVAFPQASGEAASAFGDGQMYLERFVRAARHVEVQVLGDGSETVHVFERECSLQRRRQKVVEEAPSPGIDERIRTGMTSAAVRLCKEVGYRSAGTCEFLVDDDTGEFFFIEMNTRIQVEHPVTELITGIDLVAEQLRIAAGEPLRFRQSDVTKRGHAVEFRVCAEDPERNFLPGPGKIGDVRLPGGPWVRTDTWLAPGSQVPPFYDSLVAKVIVWGDDRTTALRRAKRALSELVVEGVPTTTTLLIELLGQQWFADGAFTTGTLEEWLTQRAEAGA